MSAAVKTKAKVERIAADPGAAKVDPTGGSLHVAPNSSLPGGGAKKIWIDIDNSPHVPFFLPIIEELRKKGFEVDLTARDMYQVREL